MFHYYLITLPYLICGRRRDGFYIFPFILKRTYGLIGFVGVFRRGGQFLDFFNDCFLLFQIELFLLFNGHHHLVSLVFDNGHYLLEFIFQRIGLKLEFFFFSSTIDELSIFLCFLLFDALVEYLFQQIKFCLFTLFRIVSQSIESTDDSFVGIGNNVFLFFVVCCFLSAFFNSLF